MSQDFSRARQMMVDCQIRTSDVTDPQLVDAFLQVPREEFVPAGRKALAYIDAEVALGEGRFMPAPAAFARLVQAASIAPADVVLDIGCGAGYSTAILSRLCASVVALEQDRTLADAASRRLGELGYDNAAVVEGPLNLGYPQEGPYDVIVLNGSIETMPDAILAQLKNGGRLVAVEGHGNSAVAKLWINQDGAISPRRLFNSAVSPLPGFSRKAEFAF